MHRRLSPMRHRFVYQVFSLLLDLDEIPALAGQLKLFSHNSWNLFSYHDRDHGARNGEAVRPWIDRHLSQAGFDPTEYRILTHCFPRILGYAFNPLTVYFCYDDDAQLRAMLYEVKNTFGQQHGYLIPVAAGRRGDQPIIQTCEKAFYVSPFLDMAATYRFRLKEPRDKLSILIRQSIGGGETLLATHTARRDRLDDRRLLTILVGYPFMTVKVILGIHWEALKLWLKGARYYSRPPPPPQEVSIINSKNVKGENGVDNHVTR